MCCVIVAGVCIKLCEDIHTQLPYPAAAMSYVLTPSVQISMNVSSSRTPVPTVIASTKSDTSSASVKWATHWSMSTAVLVSNKNNKNSGN